MTPVARRIVAMVLLSLAAASAGVAGTRKCANPPAECEREIRAMLDGKPGPLGFHIERAKKGNGVVVAAVTPDTPAEKAGLKAGDRLLALDNHDVSKASMAEIRRIREKVMAEKEKEPGAGKIVITVNRVGTFRRLSLRIEKMSKAQIDKIVAAHLRDGHDMKPETD
jgi:C-terminal processing protease CtpA/Prc